MKTCSLPDNYLAARNRIYLQVRLGFLYPYLDRYGCEQFEQTARGRMLGREVPRAAQQQ